MLNFNQVHAAARGFDEDQIPTSQFDGRWMIGTLFRFKSMILSICIACVLMAVLFVLNRPATYTATAHLQLTNLRLTFSRDDAFFAETQLDPTFLETQIQILRSERIALSVVDSLKLAEQTQEAGSLSLAAWVGELMALFSPPVPDAGVAGRMTDGRALALKMVQRGLSAERVGLSNVVELKYTAPEAEQAAQIANDIVRAYVADQNAARLEAAQAGSSWLRERLREVGPKTRIIAAALPPADKSNFRGIFIIGIAGLLGAAAGVALALARSFLDNHMRTPEQVIQATQSQFFGIVPKLTSAKARTPKPPQAKGRFQIPSSNLTAVTNGQQSDLWHTLRNASYSSDESLRGNGLRSIGVTSLIRGEGCTTVASNFALCLAASGRRVLLVDADAYETHLSKRFGFAEERGLVDYTSNDHANLAQYVKVEQETGMHFLPFGGKSGVRQFDWPERMSRFYTAAGESYDCVVFDLPPLTMVGDVRAAAKFLDGFLLVVGWGGVSVEQMQVGLSSVQPVRAKVLGCILNKVDMRTMRWMPSRELDFIRLRRNGG